MHVCVGTPTPGATKIWLTRAGGCVLAHNRGQIPLHDLSEIMRILEAQHAYICSQWKRYFLTDTISFIC